MGDVLVLVGRSRRLAADRRRMQPAAVARRAGPGGFTGRAWLSVGMFALGIVVTAFDLAPTEIAFGAVVVAMALGQSLNLRTALQDLNWSIVILLACMIPLGLAVEDTGAAHG